MHCTAHVRAIVRRTYAAVLVAAAKALSRATFRAAQPPAPEGSFGQMDRSTGALGR
jgi:hypothetical protein